MIAIATDAIPHRDSRFGREESPGGTMDALSSPAYAVAEPHQSYREHDTTQASISQRAFNIMVESFPGALISLHRLPDASQLFTHHVPIRAGDQSYDRNDNSEGTQSHRYLARAFFRSEYDHDNHGRNG